MPRRTIVYSDEVIAECTQRRDAGESWASIAADLGRDPIKLKGAWARRVERLRRGFDPHADDFLAKAEKIVWEGAKDKTPPPWDVGLDGMAEAQEFRKLFSISDRHVKCHINAKGPIAITFITDVHLGSPNTLYSAFKADIKAVLNDPNIYVMKGGDWSDKFVPGFKDASAPANQLEPPTIQLVIEDQVMKALDGRIVAASGGNHDRMGERRTGIDDQYFIMRDKDFPYMPTGGRIELVVGEIEYRILWTHQYGIGHSRLNTHNVFKWLRLVDPSCDIYALEHNHDPSMKTHEVQDFDKRTVIEIRTGSYKIDDRYSQQFYKEGRIGPQTIVLWPDQKKMLGFHGTTAITDASTQLRGLSVKA